MRAVALASVLLIASGCDASESAPAPDEERGAGTAGAAPAAAEPAKSVDRFARPSDEQRIRIGEARPPEAAAAEPEGAPQEPAEAPATPERDLSAELRTLLGDPSSCLSGLADIPDAVSITVEATVTATGVITRSYARGPSIPEDAIECVRRRLDGARMRAPIDDAPRSVTTTLELRRQAPAKTEPEAAR